MIGRTALLSFLLGLVVPHSANAIFRSDRRFSQLFLNCNQHTSELNNQQYQSRIHQARVVAPRQLKWYLCRLKGGAIPSTMSGSGGSTNTAHDDNDDANTLSSHINTTKVQNNTHSMKAAKESDFTYTGNTRTTSGKRRDSRYISSLQETTHKAKQVFLDKISIVSAVLLKSEHAMFDNATKNSSNMLQIDDDSLDGNENDDEVTLQSDLMLPGRKIAIVTTASIPWFTGTAVNPLLRAAYLHRLTAKINYEDQLEKMKDNGSEHNSTTYSNDTTFNAEHVEVGSAVTLVIPWLELEEDRLELYGEKYNFTTPQEQEDYIRKWLREEADMIPEADPDTGIKIIFYNARYHNGLKSIFAMGDIMSAIPDSDADVCILEEPEHLNWFRAPGDGWTKKFRFVIGIIHTNYVDYASAHYTGLWSAPAIRVISSAMVRAYCHVVIKLSDTLQNFAEEKERISNIHGVRLDFLNEGTKRAERTALSRTVNSKNGTEADNKFKSPSDVEICSDGPIDSGSNSSDTQVYYIGKLLWAKGLDKMLDLQSYYKTCTGEYFAIDIYGNGPEEKEIKKGFHGRNSNTAVSNKDLNTSKEGNETVVQRSPSRNTNDMTTGSFSTQMAKISRHIEATKQTIKSTTESMSIDLQIPKTRYELRREPIPSSFPGRVDHATLGSYKIFVNPSESEVLCTTTAEALAMGKFVIIPVHPSNTFFMQFDNCLPYRNKLEFAANLHWALSRDPEPLKPEQKRLLTWEAATERLIDASAVTRREAKDRHRLGTSKLDERIARFHYEVGKGARGDKLRRVLGGGPIADQVAYEMMKQASMSPSNSLSASSQQELRDGDTHGNSLSFKFDGSLLAEAIRTTLSNAVPSAMASLYRADSSPSPG